MPIDPVPSTVNLDWKDYGLVWNSEEEYTDWLQFKIKESNRRLAANIEADLQGLPLPYPYPKPTCPHCGKEIK